MLLFNWKIPHFRAAPESCTTWCTLWIFIIMLRSIKLGIGKITTLNMILFYYHYYFLIDTGHGNSSKQCIKDELSASSSVSSCDSRYRHINGNSCDSKDFHMSDLNLYCTSRTLTWCGGVSRPQRFKCQGAGRYLNLLSIGTGTQHWR